MAVVSMRALLETGVHFGHRTRRWNPKMKPYIFTERNGIHIIDLQQTMAALQKAHDTVRDVVRDGGVLLFVGTKRQAAENIRLQAERCGMPFVNIRWLGGTFTNWRTIHQRIEHLLDLEHRRDIGDFERLLKHEALLLEREIERLNKRLGGIKNMTHLPDIIFVADVRREHLAIREANSMKIPVVAIVDTNCDPDPIDIIIPANDDAIRSVKLIATKMADAVLEGVQLSKDLMLEMGDGEDLYSEEDMQYLGAATLEKLKAGIASPEEGAEETPEDEQYLGAATLEKIAAAETPPAEAEESAAPDSKEQESSEEAPSDKEPAEPEVEPETEG